MKLDIKKFYDHPHVMHREWNDLVLFCYTRECQYDQLWDDVTMAARGIIFNKVTGEVVARTFVKFFNASELLGKVDLAELAKKPFTALTKMDGCFHAKTPILMPDGSYKRIIDIVRDETIQYVMGFNHNSGNIEPVRILNRFKFKNKDNWMIITTSHNWCHTVGSSKRYNISILRVTDNHEYFDGEKYKPIKEFNIGDIIYTFEPIFSSIQREVFFGSLLGDTSISRCSSGDTAVIQGFHKKEHEEYVELKKKILGSFCSNTKYERISGYGTTMVPYLSISLVYLNELKDKWYPEGIKKLPEDISEITIVSVAFLYMDNGSLSHTELQEDRALFTMSYLSEEDCNRLLCKFIELFPGISGVVFYSKGWNIRINYSKGTIDIFWRAISPYFPICMQYKLPSRYRSGKNSILHDVVLSPEYRFKKENITSLRYYKGDDAELDNSKTGYDLETDSHNYFAKGILVHNSFAIFFKYEGQDYIATKGSFVSEQAQWATKWVRSHLKSAEMLPGHTYLFEMIYPENKIVVDYGDTEDLVLLGVINNETGEEISYTALKEAGKRIGSTVVEAKEFSSLDELYAYCKTLPATEEGFVITFHNGLKVKVKGDEYCKIHRILANMTPLAFWGAWDLEAMDIPKSFLAAIPEEFRDVTDTLYQQIYDLHHGAFNKVKDTYAELMKTLPSDADHKTVFLTAQERYGKMAGELIYYHKGSLSKLLLGIHRRVRPTYNVLPDSVVGSDRLKRIFEEN